jgi:hypothetical protein
MDIAKSTEPTNMEKPLLIQQYLISYPIAMIVLSVSVASLLGSRLVKRWISIIATLGLVFFLINTYILHYPGGTDFFTFRDAGVAVLEGANPYADVAMVSPPTALPLFALMASLRVNTGLFVWTTLNIGAALALVPLSQLAVQVQTRRKFKALPKDLLRLSIATVVLSFPISWSINLGQLALLESVCLFTALYAQGKNWPMLAGGALALATIKPQTLLPFLLLFLRKSDFRTWVSFTFFVLVLCLASTPLDTLLLRIQQELVNISTLAAPGASNDYSFEGPFHYNIIGIEHALYCLGLRDRGVIRITQLVILGLLGGGLAVEIGRKGLPRGGACALVAIYSCIFLYHRFHDVSILTLPLVYTWSRGLFSERPGRFLFIATFIALLPLFFIHSKLVEVVVEAISSKVGGIQWLLNALFLPYATWLALIAMGLLYMALKTSGDDADGHPLALGAI